MTPQERFWRKVNTSGECWEWQAFRNPSGYGMFRLDGRMHLSHRVAFVFAGRGSWSLIAGREIDHACRNRACVNPTHLRLATRKQNSENRGHRASHLRGAYYIGPGRWRARVKHNGQTIHVGYFTTEAEAAEAARLCRLQLFTHNEADRLGG